MPSTIQIKRRTSAEGNQAGSPASLAVAELAFNEVDNTLYIGRTTGGTTPLTVVAIAGAGAFLSLSGTQTATGSYTFSTGTVTLNGTVTGTGINSYVTGKRLNDFTAPNAAVSFGSQQITNLAAPTADAHAATKKYVDDTVAAATPTGVAYLANNNTFSGTNTFSATTSFTTSVTTSSTTLGVFDTTATTINAFGAATALNIGYAGVNTSTTNIACGTVGALNTRTINIGTGPTPGSGAGVSNNDMSAAARVNIGDIGASFIDLRGFVSVDGSLYVNSAEVATKPYVDAIKQGLDIKDSVRVASTANVTRTGLQTIDGVALSSGDRVLLKNQSNAYENGIYVVGSSVWSRASDADTDAKVNPGLFVFVESGTAHADTGWVLVTDGAVTLETTNLTFSQFSSAGQINDGDGLVKVGNTISVGTASAGRIVVNADSIDLATAGTAGTYRSVTTDAYGRVTAGTNPTTFSGYGISDTSANLAAAITDETGSGSLVFATSPTLVTPNIGVATATSVNKVAITAPATSATLTIANSKTLTCNNTLTFTGTDSSSVAFGAGGTVAYVDSNNAFTGANTFTNSTGQTFRQAATQDGIIIRGRAGGTDTRAVTVETAALSANRTITLPNATGTVLLDSTVCAAVADCTIDGGTF